MADRIRVTSLIGGPTRLERPCVVLSQVAGVGWRISPFPTRLMRGSRQVHSATRETADEYTSRQATSPRFLRDDFRLMSDGHLSIMPSAIVPRSGVTALLSEL